MECGQKLETEVRERVVKSGNCHVVWNKSSECLPNRFLGLLQLFSDKTATFLKCNSLVAYHIHAMCLNVTARQRGYIVDQGCMLIDFFLEKSGGEKKERKKCGPEENLLMCGLTSAKVVPLKSSVSHMPSGK